MKANLFCGFLVIGSLIANVAAASEAVSIRTTQASVQLPAITAWVDMTDEKGQRLESIKPEQLSATVGSYVAEIKSVQPFSEVTKGTAFIFLVDISKSLKPQHFEQLQTAMNTWVDGMQEQDRAAIITFGSQVNVVQDFSADKAALKKQASTLAPSDMETFLYQGLVQAFQLGRRQDADLPKRRVIVVLTDGIDDAVGGATKEEVFVQLAENRVPVYAIGFALPPLTQVKEQGLKELGILARTSGGHFLKADTMLLKDAYTLQKDRIANAYELQMNCNLCKAEGQLSRLNVTFAAGGRTLSDGLDLRLLPQQKDQPVLKKIEPPAAVKPPEAFNYLPWAALALLIALLVLLRLRTRWKLTNERALKASVIASSKNLPLGEVCVTVKRVAPLPAKYNLSLTVVTGTEPGKRFNLDFNDSAVLGRAADCDLTLDDTEVSSRHAEIKFDKGILVIKDLNSMNGTLINGVPIHTPHYLQDGDRILLGRTELRLNGLQE